MVKKKKWKLFFYAAAAAASLFALYTFIFVFDNGIGWKVALIVIGIGWLLSAVSGLLKFFKE